MFRSLFTAATGMEAQQLMVDVISNNIANVNTTGFKASRANFQDLLYQQDRSPGAPSETGNAGTIGCSDWARRKACGSAEAFYAGRFH